MENEFEVDISQKEKIFAYIEKLRINYEFNESFFSTAMKKLEEELKLNEDIAKQLLKEMYQKGSSIRDSLHATENFKEKIDKAFEKFDNLPDFSETGRYDYDINSSEFTNIFSVLDELIEVDKEFYQVRDLMSISKYIIDTTKQIENKEVSEELKRKLYSISSNLEIIINEKNIDKDVINNEIEKYNEVAISIWKDYLTDPHSDDENFKNIIHNFSSGSVKGEFRNKYMSTSLITSKAMGTYGGSRIWIYN